MLQQLQLSKLTSRKVLACITMRSLMLGDARCLVVLSRLGFALTIGDVTLDQPMASLLTVRYCIMFLLLIRHSLGSVRLTDVRTTAPNNEGRLRAASRRRSHPRAGR
eukprot:2330-Heterococcus_DN1.PRE.3